MPDQFVHLPPEVLTESQKFGVLDLLATIGHFALPEKWPTSQLERDLDAYFASKQNIFFSDALAWLHSVGVKYQMLDDHVIGALSRGDAECLHIALQTGNDSNALQLLEISDASKLVELEDAGEASLSPRPLCTKADPCFLLRLGYNTENGYAYYCASLPGDSRRPVKITWASMVAAKVTAATKILPPAKPVDFDAVHNALHILEQSLATANQAHAAVLGLLGLPAVTASTEPAAVQQAV